MHLYTLQLTAGERRRRLADWVNASAPSGRACHAREEHLLPLHVCVGAALGDAADDAVDDGGVDVAFNDEVLGYKMVGFIWK
jgi:hypothetical protein